jgi:hypothetical protein
MPVHSKGHVQLEVPTPRKHLLIRASAIYICWIAATYDHECAGLMCSATGFLGYSSTCCKDKIQQSNSKHCRQE